MKAFDCNRCGACCRLVGSAPETRELDRGDGACKHLVTEEGGAHACAIYETRPMVCRVDESCPPAMALTEWQRRNADTCKQLHLHVYGTEPR